MRNFQGSVLQKIKEGIFNGPQIRKHFRDEQFDHTLSGNEKRAWNDFRLAATNFLGNNKADNYKELNYFTTN
jgi:hypothetical protein